MDILMESTKAHDFLDVYSLIPILYPSEIREEEEIDQLNNEK